MKGTKFLNIKGTVLDTENLKNYIEKTATNYEIRKTSNIQTYPVGRVKDNYIFIEKTYNLLNEHIKRNIDICSAGEWLLDNFYIIEETVKKIIRELSIKKYKELPGIANGIYSGFARIYVLASEIVAYTDSKIDDEILKTTLLAYQKQKKLNMEEIWNLWIFLEIAILENIRTVCEKIYVAQSQKYKVENIIERVIENKERMQFKTSKNILCFKNLKNEIKYPFIEYMAYKLKRLGKKGIAYFNILEDEVNKIGITIEEAIKKEHFNIAIQKVLIGNSITSIREISRINFLMLFEDINGVEEILKKDPANVYKHMDYKTKGYYREKIKEIANKTKLSENYIANKALELASKNKGKEAHVGYYLIDQGYNKLIEKLNLNRRFFKQSNKSKSKKYILGVYLGTIIFSFIFTFYNYNNKISLIYSIVMGMLAFIPISEIWIQFLNYCLMKIVKPKVIPKMDFSKGIPEEYSTVVVIPTIINSSKKVKELMHKMEIYYLANKSENLYFALLGDVTSSQNENEACDDEIVKSGLEEVERLNKKYSNNGSSKFFFLYRKRQWNPGEKCFLGWERKRGLLSEFNNFLVKGINEFRVNTLLDNSSITKKIKYVITLDSDTNLVLDSATSLIGAMAHILNEPKIKDRIVVEGYGLIQPRVGIDLESSRKTLFSKVFAGSGGTDLYANAISDVYQDNFGEGIFTGKGIYNLKVFNELLQNEIPENTVLSHDLLEGSYLRTGLATDIFLLDGCPAKYNSFISRLHRWIRGDWQLINWLHSTIVVKNGDKMQNPLNGLSRFKIVDNLRRSLVPIFSIILIIIGLILKAPAICILGIIATVFPTILDLGNYIVFKKSTPTSLFWAYKSITKIISELNASVCRGILNFIFLPNKAYITLDAIIRSTYRRKKSKQNLLEWTTSEETEKQAGTSLWSYFKFMKANIVLGIIGIIFGLYFSKILTLIVSITWAIAPYIAYEISKEGLEEIQNVKKGDKEYLNKIGEKTWKFFKDNINEKNNYLPPDNYQEDRKEKVAYRTSPTNIGLGLLAVISAYDLEYIQEEQCLNLLEKMIFTIEKLQKWNGHLYNWYNTVNLEPLMPRYISTVDSGNLVGYLYIVKAFLQEKNKRRNSC